MAFRSIAAGAGACQMLMQAVHSAFPYILFTLLILQGLAQELRAEEIENTPPCMLDPFTMRFLRAFRGVLLSDEALAILEVIAIVQGISISLKECRNAKMRRLKESYASTHQVRLGQLSARFLLSTHRISDSGMFFYKDPPKLRDSRKQEWKWVTRAKEAGAGRKLKKRLKLGLLRITNGGGAYRVFVKKKLKVRRLFLCPCSHRVSLSPKLFRYPSPSLST